MHLKNHLSVLLFIQLLFVSVSAFSQSGKETGWAYANLPDVLPGTRNLEWEGDFSDRILKGAHQLIDEKIAVSPQGRPQYWKRDFTSKQHYEKSVATNRKRFMQYLGIESRDSTYVQYNIGPGDRRPPVELQRISKDNDAELIAETELYKVYQVRWTALNRVYGEGLLIQPKKPAVGNIVALPDAGQTPEQLMGLAAGIEEKSQFARHLAENGFQVLVPVLIDRQFLFTDQPRQQTHREWLYRQSFHMGRHIIGYEVQKVIGAVDWFKKTTPGLKIGVAGYSEGGLVAFYAAAVDKRIDAALVSGYFDSRQKIVDEPLYRNVWSLLNEFGDAEIASLIAPRTLIIENSTVPEIIEKISEKKLHNGLFSLTGYKGRLGTSNSESVQAEFNRIGDLIKNGFQPRYLIGIKEKKGVPFGSEQALEKLGTSLGNTRMAAVTGKIPTDTRKSFDPEERQFRQIKEIEDHVQWLLRLSDQERNNYYLYKVMPEWASPQWSVASYHPYLNPARFVEQSKAYRDYYRTQILGDFEDEPLPFGAQSRRITDSKNWKSYRIVLDVFKGFNTAGVLLIPKNIREGEKRPVVVCQHGRNGIPENLIDENNPAYSDAAAKLADQGFVVYVPYGIYKGEDEYRWLSRKANSIGKTLFSFVLSQHRQTLKWLGSLPFVNSEKIAFYGLSYGGEMAMRVPAVLEGYCLSICSGDFGDWSRKVVDTYDKHSFMGSQEWEMPYFGMGSKFSYAEMAYLIFPRPFMVERGHHDMVQPDEWVAYEYAKVRFVYDNFGLGDKTDFDVFNGGHSMKMDGTFRFLHKHLNWP